MCSTQKHQTITPVFTSTSDTSTARPLRSKQETRMHACHATTACTPIHVRMYVEDLREFSRLLDTEGLEGEPPANIDT